MAKTNDGIVVEKNEGKQSDGNPVTTPDKSGKNPSLVRFWSIKEKHQIAVEPGKNVVFENHILILAETDPIVENIRKRNIPEIREVVNAPFSDEADRAKFNKFLNDLVYSGERNQPTRLGAKLLKGLFSQGELDDVDKSAALKKRMVTPDVLIMKAIETKSFRKGI